MPLYLTDCFERPGPERFYSLDVFLALVFIESENEDVALTPRSAWSAVARHLMPLLPSQVQATHAKASIKSWSDLFGLYIDLLGESRYKDDPIRVVANGVEAVFMHSTRPPRNYDFPQFIEVTYFLNTCDHLKLPIREIVAPDRVGDAEVFRFCKYCWRIALPNRQACPVHSAGKNPNAMVLPPALSLESPTPSGRHKEGYRQKDKFDKRISKLLTNEVLEFHNNNFDASVFFPTGDWMPWLVKRRPRVWEALTHIAPDAPNDQVAQLLVDLLHNPESLNSSLRAGYLSINQMFIQDTRLMWPMLLRAECWLSSRQARQQGWGGNRKKPT